MPGRAPGENFHERRAFSPAHEKEALLVQWVQDRGFHLVSIGAGKPMCPACVAANATVSFATVFGVLRPLTRVVHEMEQ